MNGKVISCNQQSNGLIYRVEIFEDEACTELVGEANVIGSESFSREKQFLNKTMVKRYAKSVANRRGNNYPWFISDELAQKYGITIDLPVGFTLDMKPSPDAVSKRKYPGGTSNQMPIDEYFLNSSAGFLAEELSVSPPPPQFSFPCDDAIVPVELIDQDLKYPELVPVDQFIKDSNLLTRSLSIWSFFQTFTSQLRLTPFSYDDWEEALTCTSPSISTNPIIEEAFLALLSTVMKDRRNLTKGAFADKLKSAVLTFKPEMVSLENDNKEKEKELDNATISNSAAFDEPEIVISSTDSDLEEEGAFVKRSLNSKTTSNNKKQKITLSDSPSMLLPAIDLRKHRWYESKSMEYWHFVLGAFFLEAIDFISQFVAEEKAKEAEESDSSDSSEVEEDEEVGNNDSAYEDDESETDGDNAKSTDGAADVITSPKPVLKQLNASSIESSLEIMQNFIKIIEPIVEELISKGSKNMFTSYLNLSLPSKLSLLEFLVHNHHEREAFKAFVEECLERQGEARRVRKEMELEAKESVTETERLENEVARLKEDNLKITERLDAAEESDIEMSESESEPVTKGAEEEFSDVPLKDVSNPLPPLTEIERDELIKKRAANKKEITSLNAILRKVRPEASALQRKLDAATRDLRKCSSFRTFSLGYDRFGREYWWFGEFVNPIGRLLVFDPNKQAWQGSLDSEEAFNQFMTWLNPLGIREAKLKAALLDIEEDVKIYLSERDLPEELRKQSKPIVLEIVDPLTKNESDSEEVDFDSFRRGRGRPPKGSTANNLSNIPSKRPFQKYKNTL